MTPTNPTPDAIRDARYDEVHVDLIARALAADGACAPFDTMRKRGRDGLIEDAKRVLYHLTDQGYRIVRDTPPSEGMFGHIHAWQPEENGSFHCDQCGATARALAQIGAVPAAGDGILIEPMSVQAMRIRRWAEFAFDHAECPEWDDEDQALYAALGTLANGADDGA